MKLILKLVGSLLLLVVMAAGAGVAYLFTAFPKADPPSSVKIEATPERLERGRYLAENVSGCVSCHSERDWTKFAGPVKAGTEGKGGQRFADGVPGVLYSRNITPAAVGTWTDGELIRAITGGVSRDGTPLFPLMAYPSFGRMAEDDVHAIVAYIRSLKAVDHVVPDRTLTFPMNLITRTIPEPGRYGARPPVTDTVAYGEYMVNAALCGDCHTPIDNRGQPLPGREFSGGMEFTQLGYRVRSANITPDADTGIGSWTEQQFVDKFKSFATPDDHALTDAERRQFTEMPWGQYARMTREDLSAVYAYLRTLKPVVNRVTKHPDALGR